MLHFPCSPDLAPSSPATLQSCPLVPCTQSSPSYPCSIILAPTAPAPQSDPLLPCPSLPPHAPALPPIWPPPLPCPLIWIPPLPCPQIWPTDPRDPDCPHCPSDINDRNVCDQGKNEYLFQSKCVESKNMRIFPANIY